MYLKQKRVNKKSPQTNKFFLFAYWLYNSASVIYTCCRPVLMRSYVSHRRFVIQFLDIWLENVLVFIYLTILAYFFSLVWGKFELSAVCITCLIFVYWGGGLISS